MPRIKRSETSIKQSYLTGIIRKYMDVSGMSANQAAKRLGLSPSAYHAKLRGDSCFTYPETYELVKVLHIPVEEMMQCYTFKVGREAAS